MSSREYRGLFSNANTTDWRAVEYKTVPACFDAVSRGFICVWDKIWDDAGISAKSFTDNINNTVLCQYKRPEISRFRLDNIYTFVPIIHVHMHKYIQMHMLSSMSWSPLVCPLWDAAARGKWPERWTLSTNTWFWVQVQHWFSVPACRRYTGFSWYHWSHVPQLDDFVCPGGEQPAPGGFILHVYDAVLTVMKCCSGRPFVICNGVVTAVTNPHLKLKSH